jgi:hypothetical protein
MFLVSVHGGEADPFRLVIPTEHSTLGEAEDKVIEWRDVAIQRFKKGHVLPSTWEIVTVRIDELDIGRVVSRCGGKPRPSRLHQTPTNTSS